MRHGVAALLELRDDRVAVVALDLDHVVLHAAAGAAAALELAGQRTQRVLGQAERGDRRDGLAAPALRLAAHAHDAVAARRARGVHAPSSRARRRPYSIHAASESSPIANHWIA